MKKNVYKKNIIKGQIKLKKQYICPKCANQHYESDKFQASGGNFARFSNIQNKKFITISCTKCGYTELYKAKSSLGLNILDFLIG